MAKHSGLWRLGCVRRAAERAAANFHLELGRGTMGLRTIARTAPLLGLFGTAVLLVNALRAASFPGYSTCDCAGGVAETIVPLALSFPVTIFASIGLHCLGRKIEALDLEMRCGTLDVLDHLARRCAGRE